MRATKLRVVLSFLFAAFSWSISNAQTAFDFKGTIGKYPVVVSLYGYMSDIEGDMYYVSQGKNKKLQLRGECISELDSNQLSWKFIETVNGRYNGTYYVVWNAFVGGSKNMVGTYVNAKGREFQVNFKCVKTEFLRER